MLGAPARWALIAVLAASALSCSRPRDATDNLLRSWPLQAAPHGVAGQSGGPQAHQLAQPEVSVAQGAPTRECICSGVPRSRQSQPRQLHSSRWRLPPPTRRRHSRCLPLGAFACCLPALTGWLRYRFDTPVQEREQWQRSHSEPYQQGRRLGCQRRRRRCSGRLHAARALHPCPALCSLGRCGPARGAQEAGGWVGAGYGRWVLPCRLGVRTGLVLLATRLIIACTHAAARLPLLNSSPWLHSCRAHPSVG